MVKSCPKTHSSKQFLLPRRLHDWPYLYPEAERMTVLQYGDRTLILGLFRQWSKPLKNGTIVFMNQQQTNQLPASCPLANAYTVALQQTQWTQQALLTSNPCFVVKGCQSIKMRNIWSCLHPNCCVCLQLQLLQFQVLLLLFPFL